MAKMIRIEDSVYTQLKDYAENNGRSISNAGNFIIEGYMGTNWSEIQLRDSPITETPTTITPSPEKTEPSTPERYNQAIETADIFKEPVKQMLRTKGDVLSDIRALVCAWDEELRYCQDDEIGRQITEQYADKVNPLWEEYNGL